MKAFHFPLQKALDLGITQLGLEEARYKKQLFEVAELDRKRAEVEASGLRAEVQVRAWPTLASCDLTALGNFRLRARKLEAQILTHRGEKAKEADARRLGGSLLLAALGLARRRLHAAEGERAGQQAA